LLGVHVPIGQKISQKRVYFFYEHWNAVQFPFLSLPQPSLAPQDLKSQKPRELSSMLFPLLLRAQVSSHTRFFSPKNKKKIKINK
jgi:hypothetical protein